MSRFFFLFLSALFLFSDLIVLAQVYPVSGKVIDSETGEPLAFVNVVINQGQNGAVTDIDGKFSLSVQEPILTLTFSYVGYESYLLHVEEKTRGLLIKLQRTAYELSEVTILPGENPAHRIIRNVIENRENNDPEKLPSFSYISYDKMYFTIDSDSLFLKDTADLDTSSLSLRSFLEAHYLFLMETVSERKFLSPDRNYERVVASRISGFKDPIFIFLISQIQSTSFYDELIRISDKVYINPISRGSTDKYLFILEDTLFLDPKYDTTFVIAYRPFKGTNFDGLKGLLYISSAGWAIQNVIAEPALEGSGITMKIQQKYELMDDSVWFPVQLNTDIMLPMAQAQAGDKNYQMTGIGKSYIEHIVINPELVRREFSNIEVEVDPGAYQRNDSYWNGYRTDTLTLREQNTYQLIDSIGKEHNFDELAKGFETLMTGKIPWKFIDFDLRKFIQYNDYEGFYAGIGASTNRNVSEVFKAGGFAGYGFRDQHVKYGLDLSVMAYRRAELVFGAGYQNYVSEPGGTQFFDDFEKFSYEQFRNPLLMRMDRMERFEASTGFRSFSYLRTHITFSRTYKEPGYEYYYGEPQEGVTVRTNSFHFTELSIGLKYAYKEKFLSNTRTKISLGTHWPVVWLTYTRGFKDVLAGEFEFNRLDLKIQKSFFIKYIGETSLLLRAGYIDTPLPYTNLYTGNGSYHSFTIFAPNSFATMRLNEFLVDRYLALYFTHNFGKLLLRKKGFDPEIVLMTNIGFGTLEHPEYHSRITFTTMEKGFFESGININNILNISNLVAIGAGVHYRYGPYHLDKELDNFGFKLCVTLPLLSNSL
jgi:hypothetical protein